jgi:hypothetical protein
MRSLKPELADRLTSLVEQDNRDRALVEAAFPGGIEPIEKPEVTNHSPPEHDVLCHVHRRDLADMVLAVVAVAVLGVLHFISQASDIRKSAHDLILTADIAELEVRPHQALGDATPAERFTTTSTLTEPEPNLLHPAAHGRGGSQGRREPLPTNGNRDGPGWISRKVGSNGIVCVNWQQSA